MYLYEKYPVLCFTSFCVKSLVFLPVSLLSYQKLTTLGIGAQPIYATALPQKIRDQILAMSQVRFYTRVLLFNNHGKIALPLEMPFRLVISSN
ncbi:hypothetical protein AB205_0033640 [Aquarana catesbeiana]|uniref:Uncharacterized protein n=1 Tax=Aquarana catesbeiana TaxID=8400 RepID=A0A2G9S054_AQUCT|nr:hypothetical protein AB205_0033640 [Aquarana catesbeiana]